MTTNAAARRYARALFDVVLQKKGDIDRTAQELDAFDTLVSGNAALAGAFANPAVPAAKKRAVVEAILAQSGSVSDPVARTLGMLADRDRLTMVPQLAKAFRERVMDHRNIVRAEVTTAIPLEGDRSKAVADALGRATGRQVVVEEKVDPSILGGVVARVGSVVYDGSVARQLERMKESLIESGQ